MSEHVPEVDTSETVQTVQEAGREVKGPSRRSYYFEVAEDENEKWHWALWSPNGRLMAVSAIPFDRRHDCTTSIEHFKDSVQAARIVVAHD